MNPQHRDVLIFMLQHQQNQLIQAQHILAVRRRRRRRRWRVVRNIWVRDWIARRPQLGLYDSLMVELRNEDPTAFFPRVRTCANFFLGLHVAGRG